MAQAIPLAYLDHNALDLMTKGDPDGIADLLGRAMLTPVFSTENLAEIRRSVGYEKCFLDVLDRIDARHLVPVLDNQCRHTGDAEIRHVNASDAYADYVTYGDTLPELGFGLSGMLQKAYGGRQDQSFKEIFAGGAGELRELLKNAVEGLANVPELNDQIRAVLVSAPDEINEQYNSLAAQLDAHPGPIVKRFEQATALGPKVLKNIQGPDVVLKVWRMVKANSPGISDDLEAFFGIKPFPHEADENRERTTLERVNAIYHQLNFIGYYRDSNMNKQRRFVASFSDMTHAGLASFCHLLICRDEDLVMKAAAAYEYLKVDTHILHYRG